ncbi:hypothetical protein [Bradyrhizobium nanningense]|uniref:hypothetical protein n=1 Tax=Bradyrhizobium nanningense TaxID=1325118 RepID=UPI001008A050|nr:hypothetical protein [Bradyrhizobium nanningense]
MPTDLMRVNVPPASRPSSARNFNIVAIVLTAALVTLQLVGLAILERSRAQATQMSFAHTAAVCPEGLDADAPQIPTD